MFGRSEITVGGSEAPLNIRIQLITVQSDNTDTENVMPAFDIALLSHLTQARPNFQQPQSKSRQHTVVNRVVQFSLPPRKLVRGLPRNEGACG